MLGGIDDLCLKYFVEAGAMAVRRCKKVDLKRIAKCSGAHFVTSLANLEGEESFEAAFLGKSNDTCRTPCKAYANSSSFIQVKPPRLSKAASATKN